MDSRHRDAIDRLGLDHGLWTTDMPVRTLAEGDENVTVELGGYIVRFSADPEGGTAIGRENELLRELAKETNVPIPEPVICDADMRVMVYRRLPGMPLLGRDLAHVAPVADGLIDLLSAMRRLGDVLHLPGDDYDDDAWHDDAAKDFEVVRSRLDPRQAAVIDEFLHAPPPPRRTRIVPSHNDLGTEHLLVDDGRLSGVIDWTDAAMADAARDLGSIYRDLGGEVAFSVAAALDGPVTDADAERIVFHARCRWIEDVRYALDDPRRRAAYLRNALRNFPHTFGAAGR